MATTKCVACKVKNAVYPANQDVKRYCKTCWSHKFDKLFKARDEFEIQRYLRTNHAEMYFIRHPSNNRADAGNDPCGKCIVIREAHFNDSDFFNIQLLLHDNFNWKKNLLMMSDDDEAVTYTEAAVEVVMKILESWGGGQAHVDVYHADQGDYSVEIEI